MKAKEFLSQKGVPYQAIDVSTNREAAMEMVRKSRQMGVPVITVGDEVVVGFDRPRLERLLRSNAEGRPTFGASVADASRITAKQGGIPIFGAYVGKVAPGSPAAKAGLAAGDIVTEINMRPIRNADDLTAALSAVPVGGRVVVIWTRGEKTQRAEVSFGATAGVL